MGGPLYGGGQVSADGMSWGRYQETGLTCIYDRGMILVAVEVDALAGPLVRFGEVKLIGRVPSEVRADIRELARREGTAVRVNWSGDPEIVAWGVSMGTAQGWGVSAEGYLERKDAVVTSALLVGPELADDPYATAPVMHAKVAVDHSHRKPRMAAATATDRPLRARPWLVHRARWQDRRGQRMKSTMMLAVPATWSVSPA
ncbi:hypothetical protein ACFY2M_10705 [Streptomyces sp. NPDC001276]|uniref:hypothetical protein n=1 Tax=Streptomyces sp. NPDC001276 TaxID=3364555 RepID=UPI003673F778